MAGAFQQNRNRSERLDWAFKPLSVPESKITAGMDSAEDILKLRGVSCNFQTEIMQHV
jgi:hypothetical protein